MSDTERARLLEALDCAIYHAENLQRLIDLKPVRDLEESRLMFERARQVFIRA